MIRKTQLVTRDTGQGSGRSTNFGGKVRQRADIVAVDRRDVGHLRADQLHSVTAVAAEADHDGFNGFFPFAFALLLRIRGIDCRRHDSITPERIIAAAVT